MQRVVITGVGMINAVGSSAQESFSNMIKGVSGVALITHFDASEDSVQIAAEVKNFNPCYKIRTKGTKPLFYYGVYSRFTCYQ